MPQSLGTQSKSIILVGPESHKLTQEFTAGPHLGKITLSADLVASDSVDGKVQGVAFSQVTYATSHANTMALLVTALKAHASIADAKIDPDDARSILFYLKDTTATPVIADLVVTHGGAGTANATSSVKNNFILQGEPVMQMGVDEMVVGLSAASAWYGVGAPYIATRCIGMSAHYANPGELITVFVKGYVVTYGKLAGTMVPGPCKVIGKEDVVTTAGYEFGYVNYANTAVTTDFVGWLLDGGDDNDIVRVLQAN